MQQKMDALKEEKSPRTPDEEEPQDSEFALKPVEEVRSLFTSHLASTREERPPREYPNVASESGSRRAS